MCGAELWSKSTKLIFFSFFFRWVFIIVSQAFYCRIISFHQNIEFPSMSNSPIHFIFNGIISPIGWLECSETHNQLILMIIMVFHPITSLSFLFAKVTISSEFTMHCNWCQFWKIEIYWYVSLGILEMVRSLFLLDNAQRLLSIQYKLCVINEDKKINRNKT